ncbi:hypothetical protein [Streptomyces sp. A0592]|uniref:hypothetical protein n=1 Tax=Streptomyces sp. A0592 TaxID=2563099 RepID=UPI00109EC63E|nr:hypothetical protein [Streptomyces sp. A0592]THA85611.1 hypothetical protein E6U81_06155 [Streptomyces sp. A0592]
MTAMKRTLAALVLSGGAALALVPAAHAADEPSGAAPLVGRVVDIADHPAQTVQDAKTAVAVTQGAVGSATKATDSSLGGAGTALDAGLPKTPKVE